MPWPLRRCQRQHSCLCVVLITMYLCQCVLYSVQIKIETEKLHGLLFSSLDLKFSHFFVDSLMLIPTVLAISFQLFVIPYVEAMIKLLYSHQSVQKLWRKSSWKCTGVIDVSEQTRRCNCVVRSPQRCTSVCWNERMVTVSQNYQCIFAVTATCKYGP